MNELLQKARMKTGRGCVTITMNTHRTLPDNQQDPIMLKKLLKEAMEKLASAVDRETAEMTGKNLYRAAAEIDYWQNMDSLVIFADSDFAGTLRLPVSVTDRATVGSRFATKDIIRVLHEELSYYILVLSRNEARLLTAWRDRLIGGGGGSFPMNNPLYTSDPVKLTNRHGNDDLIAEFFNNVDKALWNTIKDDIKPVILSTERRNYDYYMEIADRPELILGFVTRNGEDQPQPQIVAEAWKEASEILRADNLRRLDELDRARGRGLLVWDYSEVWNALEQGRGRTLFVRKGLHLPASVASNPDGLKSVLPGGNVTTVTPAGTPDAVDDMVNMILDGGGEVVFIDGDELDPLGGIALVVRYPLEDTIQEPTSNGQQ